MLSWRDVTERDRIDAEHTRLASIVRISDDAIMSLDADMRITSWNGGAEAIFGYSAEEILGKSRDVLIPADAPRESQREVLLRRRDSLLAHRRGGLAGLLGQLQACETFAARIVFASGF